jgi:RimJ/RimL family protein N-acetyltransferase
VSATPTLTGSGIVLRPLVHADAPALFVALCDADVQRYRRGGPHAEIADTARYIEDTLSRSHAAWAITERGGEALGRLALRLPLPEVGEFGIVIRREAQRRGLGLKALMLAQAYGFEALHLARLRADIDAENEASLALFRRAGFTQEERATTTTEPGVRDSIVLAKARPGR